MADKKNEDDYYTLFRMTVRDPRTGKVRRRADGKPWPIRVKK